MDILLTIITILLAATSCTPSTTPPSSHKKCLFFLRGFQLTAQKRPFCKKTAILAEKTLDSSARMPHWPKAYTNLQSLKTRLFKDYRQKLQGQSLKRGHCKDWSQEMQRQSLKRGLNKDWKVAARLFQVKNGSGLNFCRGL